MKKKNYSFLMVLFFLCITIVSCSDDDYSSSDLVGEWSLARETGYEKDFEYPEYDEEWDYTYDVGEIIYKFNKNGICEITDYFTIYAEWKMKGNKLHILFEEDEEVYTGTAKIISLTSTELVLEVYEKDEDFEYYEKIYLQRMN